LKRLHVLQISHGYSGPFVKVCNQYACAFAGHRITTVFLKGEARLDVVEAVGGDEVRFLEQDKRTLRGIKLQSILRMARILRESPIDIVVAHRYKSIYIAGVLGRFFTTPIIIGVAHEHGVFRRFSRKLLLILGQKNILLAGVSDSVVQDIAGDCPSLGQQHRLYALPNAIDVKQEQSLLNRTRARQQLGLADKEFVVGSIGRLVSKKNYEVLIQAFAELHEPQARLLLIGDGPRRKALQSLAETLGIQDRVVFAGHHENAQRLVKALDIFVLSSGNEEAFGIVLLEAMLGKVPVISSNAPGPSEVLAGTGVQFESGDSNDLSAKMEHLINQPENERQRLGEAGYQRVLANYSYKKFSEALWQLPGLNQLVESTDVAMAGHDPD